MSDPTNRPLSDWLADLEISEAELAAGDTVPLASVLAELDESMKRLKDKRQRPPGRAAAGGR